MANSILEALGFGSIAPQRTPLPEPPGMPSPNPLRLPPQPPSVGGGFPGAFLLPELEVPFLNLIRGIDSPEVARAKAANAEAEARRYYNAPEVQMPLPERGAHPNLSNSGETSPSPGDDGEGDADGESDETPPVPVRNPFKGGGEVPASGAGPSRGPGGDVRVPVSRQASVIDPFRAMMMQIGLSLMTPSWGNTLSQVGQSLGQGAAAAGRANQLNDAEEDRVRNEASKDEDRNLKRRKIEADIAHTEATTEDIPSGESSRARRLRGKTPTAIDEAAKAAGLGPKGKAFLATRIKSLNAQDVLEEDYDPVTKFNEIIEQAKKLDEAPAANTPGSVPDPNRAQANGMTLPIVKSPEEAMKLQPGTQFLYEDPKTKRLTLGERPKG